MKFVKSVGIQLSRMFARFLSKRYTPESYECFYNERSQLDRLLIKGKGYARW